MERPEGQLSAPSENDSPPTASTSEVLRSHDPQILGDRGAKAAGDLGAETPGDQDTHTAADSSAPADADGGAQAAAALDTLLEGKEEMSRSQDEPPHELENQFILRLPPEHASTVRKLLRSRSVSMKDKLKIDISPDGRHAVVEVEAVSLTAKLVDLPCVIGSLKTHDKNTFYKTADISQMLVCTADGDSHSSPEEPATSTDLKVIGKDEREGEKKYVWKHGITPPLKNVRKKRFRKTKQKLTDVEEINLTEDKDITAKPGELNDVTGSPFSPAPVQYIESPDVEKEVKKLLCSDAEAISARWEVIGEDGTKEIDSQGFIPVFETSPGISGYKQGGVSSECDTLREMFSDSSSDSDDEEEDDEDEDEEDDYEEALERELQAKLIESDQYEAKEGASSITVEIQKEIYYMEKKLREIQYRAERQKNLIMKLENLMLKSHLQSALERLKIEEKQKSEQLISLREQLKYLLEK
uniref:TATA-box binding protein associated factor 7 like n=2 Tax=Equus asinus TaxID=9793 RepID=A0A8C4LT52_EQUAS|nr:transcription initiation factor TFIID subunit 7-like isoform X2 [Equus asinus]